MDKIKNVDNKELGIENIGEQREVERGGIVAEREERVERVEAVDKGELVEIAEIAEIAERGEIKKLDENLFNLIKLAQNTELEHEDIAKDAIEVLIKNNSGLIWSIVRKFLNRGYDADDLYQIGAIGLIKCIKKFDMSYDVKFSTYAVPMILGEIKRFIRDDGMIKVSRPLKEIATKAKYMKDFLTKQNNREPSVNEVAEALNVDVEDLILALDADRDIESLYSTVYQGDGRSVYLIDKLEEESDTQEKIVENILLQDLINSLEKREQEIINLRYFKDKTQSEVAKKIGISQVQVSRIEKKILKKIRNSIGDKD